MKEGNKIFNILTAIGDEKLNNSLKKEKEFNILQNDIFYKEGVIEFLEENSNIDILILYQSLSGDISFIDLIEKIKLINNKITFFVILENKNEKLENQLIKQNIKNIFYINELNINEFIKKIKNSKINIEDELKKEIQKLNIIINKKDEEIRNLKNIKINLDEIKNNRILVKKSEEKVEITVFKVKKYFINKKIQKNVIKKINSLKEN